MSTPAASPPQPPAPPPAAPAAKKKTSPLVWILVGCLGLVVVVGVVVAVATAYGVRWVTKVGKEIAENPVRESVELMVRLNPELELVSTDDVAETVTIRNKTTGEVSTFDWSDIQNGEFRFETDGQEYSVDASEAASGRIEVEDAEGRSTFSLGSESSEVPSWFPEYPNAVEVNVLINASQDGQDSTIWTFKSADPVSDVLAFYEGRLEADEWEVETASADSGGMTQGSVDAKKEGGARTLNLVATSTESGSTQVMVTATSPSG